MKLDIVHDIQNSYRKVLKSMSRPGVVTSLINEASKVNIETGCRQSTFIIMLMLLDREVTFNIVSKNEDSISKIVSQMTYSKSTSIDKADYIFVLEDASEEALSVAIKQGKIGDLINPNKSSTIITEVKYLSSKYISENKAISLEGPGIKEYNLIDISGDRSWIKERDMKNEEYPLGIDLIFIDSESNLVCLPRTTRIIEGGDRKWDM